MPKIEVSLTALKKLTHTNVSVQELEQRCVVAKAEIDEVHDDIIKVELNDTNRPDLWSTVGFCRQLSIYQSGQIPQYDFFSSQNTAVPHDSRQVIVDNEMRKIRPYIAAFVMKGPSLRNEMLKDFIQMQEKLTENYGQKRRAVAMGIYRADLIRYPVHYKAVDPDSVSFVPLNMDSELSLKKIIEQHPTGKEYGHILEHVSKYPLLVDDEGHVLSLPPIINSAHIGSIQVGDTHLFVEFTGQNMDTLLHSASIVACNAADLGYTIEPVMINYPYDTPYGRAVTVPYYFQETAKIDVSMVKTLLGENMDDATIQNALRKMGFAFLHNNGSVFSFRVPEYRNDILHSVDLAEDVMIGYGIEKFTPEMPAEFTMGRLTELEITSRNVKPIMVGLGYQEMVFQYLGSQENYIEKMYAQDDWLQKLNEAVQIANPLSENYAFVRPSILPALLASESVSAHAVYPHRVFEIGKVALCTNGHIDEDGTQTRTYLGFLCAHKAAGFTEANEHISAIFYYMNQTYSLQEVSDSRFVDGRTANIIIGGTSVGIFGEIHPRTLEQWGIQIPCVGGEFWIENAFP